MRLEAGRLYWSFNGHSRMRVIELADKKTALVMFEDEKSYESACHVYTATAMHEKRVVTDPPFTGTTMFEYGRYDRELKATSSGYSQWPKLFRIAMSLQHGRKHQILTTYEEAIELLGKIGGVQ